MLVGAHESASGGPARAVARALEDECESLQIFVKNNNRWTQRAWTEGEAEEFRAAWAASGLRGLMAHAAYLINPCSPRPDVVDKSRAALLDELRRCRQLGVEYLVMHPGSPGSDRAPEDGIAAVGAMVRELRDAHGADFDGVKLLFENTAGQGTNLGWRLEELRDLLAACGDDGWLGVCWDTCHAHAAGYDLTTRDGYDEHWGTFDAVVGLEHLKAFHLNDSKRELGSRVDRHEVIGDGEVGLEPFEMLMRDQRFACHPAALETPPLPDGTNSYAHCLRILKGMRGS